MSAIVSLLRGVNVGGHHQIRMEALRALYESLGLRDAQTCLQSGNVVFRSRIRDMAGLSARIADAIESGFGFRPEVILRSADEMNDVVSRSPFAGRNLEPSKVAVLFLAGPPQVEAPAIACAPDEFRIDGREVYLYFPNGMGRPKLSTAALEKSLRVAGTARNWNTVKRLAEMAGAYAP